LKVLFLGIDEDKHPGNLPRTYTLTHSDVTSKLTLAISQTINNTQVFLIILIINIIITIMSSLFIWWIQSWRGSHKQTKNQYWILGIKKYTNMGIQLQLQGWYNRLQRDEVVAQWKKVKGKMSLHVHCHISGGHFLLDMFARLRYFIFCKELPVVSLSFFYYKYLSTKFTHLMHRSEVLWVWTQAPRVNTGYYITSLNSFEIGLHTYFTFFYKWYGILPKGQVQRFLKMGFRKLKPLGIYFHPNSS